jgi:hypothetical protein
MERWSARAANEALHSQRMFQRLMHNQLFGRPMPDEDFTSYQGQFGDLFNRVLASPQDHYSDQLLDQRRRAYSAGVFEDANTAADLARRRMAGRGMANSGLYERELGRLYEDARADIGAFRQMQLENQAARRTALDQEDFNRAYSLLNMSLGTPVSYYPSPQQPGPGQALAGSAGDALETYGMMKFLGPLMERSAGEAREAYDMMKFFGPLMGR